MTAGPVPVCVDAALQVSGPIVGAWPRVVASDGSRPVVTLTVTDHAGHRWSATGPADANDAANARSGPSELALWTQLQGPAGCMFALSGPAPVDVTAAVVAPDRRRVAGWSGGVAVTRRSVVCRAVDEADFAGVLVAPSTAGPGVVLLGGSEGGVRGALPTALALADRGSWCLIVDYRPLAANGAARSEVPVEPILAGLRWLAQHPSVNRRRVMLWGASKGAEAALVAAAYSPVVSGVVSVSGSPVVFEGLDPSRRASSWTIDGAPVPFTQMARVRAWAVFARRGRPATLRPIYRRGPRAVRTGAASTAHLERLQVPVLMLAGTDDRLWPAAEMDELAHRRCPGIHAQTFAGCGHLLTVPGIPPVLTVGRQPTLRTGGSREHLPDGIDRAWDATLAALHRR